jgi:hypothetical protein
MIIRTGGTSQFLITQPDHAALAARIMRVWLGDGLPDSPRRPDILRAIDEHDHGWADVDAAPIVDAATGGILDFVNAPDTVRRQVWPRGVERLEATPYAAALVAHHAIHVYRRYRPHPEWTAFFRSMEEARARFLRATQALTLNELFRDYLYLRVGDLVSLTFCNAWTEVQTDDSGYAIRLDEARLIITPDPFAGSEVPVEVPARELPNRPFESPEEACEVFAATPTVTLTGVIKGAV